MKKSPIPPIKVFGDVAPRNNPAAIRGMRLGFISLVPGLALITGPLAVAFGIIGARRYRATPKDGGKGQSRVAIVLGGLAFLSHALGLGCIAYGQGWIGAN